MTHKWPVLFLTLLPLYSWSLNLSELQGADRAEYRSPNGLRELCVISKKWPGGVYTFDDVEKEHTLCSYNFYTNMGICPKYTSTNPAILLLKPNAQYSKSAIDASNCDIKAMKVKTDAKFKQSVSCSYSPAIVAYYHVSRILGNVGRVPTSVIRTMDKDVHAKLTRKAIDRLKNKNDAIRLSWERFGRIHALPQNYPFVIDDSVSQVYGALSDNIKNEEQYTEVSGVGSYETRYERFLSQKPFLRVTNSRTVEAQLGTRDFAKIAQTVVQMKDVSDLVLLDTLLSQQDRIGNIHYKFYWYVANLQTKKVERAKSEAEWVNGKIKIPPEELRAVEGKQAALIKEMVLKDNDCAIIKTNMMRQISALEKVRHMSYSTFRRFLALERALRDSYTRDYFITELLLTGADYQTLINNATKAKEILVKKCQSRELLFDVDLETYIPGAPLPIYSCEM